MNSQAHHRLAIALSAAVAVVLALAAGRAHGEVAGWQAAAPTPGVELDIDGDTRIDTATVVMSGDGLRTAVELCLSTRVHCEIVADSAVGASPLSVARRAPGCHDYLHEGDAPVQPRPGNVCTTADVLETRGAAMGPSLIALDTRTGEFVRYWLAD
jgi:hypothetical protein